MARPKPGGTYGTSSVRSHRAPRRTSGGYRGRHRDGLFARLAGRPTVTQIQFRNASRPGVFPGFADVWHSPRKTTTYRSLSFGSLFNSWT